MNSLPRPGPSLRASTVPPCMVTRLRTSVRPMPSPPCAWRLERSTWVNISKTEPSRSAGMPMPLSRTETTARLPSFRRLMPICPPGRVYFAELLRRLAKTWVSRTLSPCTMIGSGGRSTVSWCPAASSAGRLVSMAECSTNARSTGSRWTSMRPRVMRETSSKSSTSLTRWLIWRSITGLTRLTTAPSLPDVFNS